MIKSGLAFHCHHNTLVEEVYDYGGRVEFIKENKPKQERELRLKLLKFIPEDRLPHKGLAAYDKARDAYDKAWDAYVKARDAYDKAGDAYVKANKNELEQLHKELCPDCPFDGHTIFTRKDEQGKYY